MSASAKKKSSNHVTVKVKSQAHEPITLDDISVYFRIKKDVGLRKMMEAFSVKKGEDMTAFAFLFDGDHIKPDQSPNDKRKRVSSLSLKTEMKFRRSSIN
ncbi:unnamed protein product [Eruca vesicaria subsp. sativa]|uniref:Rad60/SUMO-like domain-containing protein n=1 Tax=Eruca vesicaria subsp. sativa TaxID=29727 RepID=A0ABC8M9M0_ERUVS|nr:unnamed protein product [Eruca vesicaria subsp. sativa]